MLQTFNLNEYTINNYNKLQNLISIIKNENNRDELIKLIPFIKDYNQVDNKNTVYVCENCTCKSPVIKIDEFKRILMYQKD